MDEKENRSRSRSPHRSDSSENKRSGGWKCNNCSNENNSDRDKCIKCRLPKGKDKKDLYTEDWECEKCRANNFSRRLDCFKCHARKPPVDPKHPYDWECRQCKGNNYSRRIDCFKCGEPKPRFISSSDRDRGGRGDVEVRDGSWFCDCGALNYSRRTDCFKCGLPKPRHFSSRSNYDIEQRVGMSRLRSPTPERGYRHRSPHRQRSPIRIGSHTLRRREESNSQSIAERDHEGYNPGSGSIPERAPDVDPVTGESEWCCPVCGVNNFYKRFDCYRCFEKKPLENGVIVRDGKPYSERESSRPPYSERESSRPPYSPYINPAPVTAPPPGPLSIPKKRFASDWICPECKGLNYSKRTDCFKCHLAKPEDGQGYDSRNQVENSRGPVRAGDWTCPSCDGNNFSRRTTCYRCNDPKPEGDAIAAW